jgi:holo-[acyl-carrier protein] synthase
MIYGVGTDIVSVIRIQRTLDRHGARFAQRILSAAEQVQFSEVNQSASWLSKRWAAKEAFVKAAGTGMRDPFTFAAIAVETDAHGKPAFNLNATVKRWLEQRGIVHTHVSLSDEREYAIAFVILER